ncbi:SixA phosphatase family protein [Algoriphagus namhaensis]
MKKLILVRHGKSAWDNLALADHDRPLAPRGLRDVPKMASKLRDRDLSPDYFLSSTALRAKQTAELTAEQLGFSKSGIAYRSELYHCSSQALLQNIQTLPDSAEVVLLFGHNPGFNDLIEDLGEDLDNLPTSGQFAFQADIKTWDRFGPTTATFLFYDFPKKS